MAETANTVYAKDDGNVTIFGGHPQHGDCVLWEWDNDGETGTEIFPLHEAARELKMSGREDLAQLIEEA